MTITQIERIYRRIEYVDRGAITYSSETLADAKVIVASWGGENQINFWPIWFDSYMDDIADSLMSPSGQFPPGMFGEYLNSAIDPIGLQLLLGRFIDELGDLIERLKDFAISESTLQALEDTGDYYTQGHMFFTEVKITVASSGTVIYKAESSFTTRGGAFSDWRVLVS